MHLIEQAASGRAKCRGCGNRIAGGELRFGERLPNPFTDDGGEMTHWYHLACAAYRRPEAFLEGLASATDPLPDHDRLRLAAEHGITFRRLPRISAAGRATTGRATCRACRAPIAKDTWRISLVFYEDGRFAPSGFIHVACAASYFDTTDIVDRLRHFSPELAEGDVDEIRAALAG